MQNIITQCGAVERESMAGPRMFNSTTPFKELKGGPAVEFPFQGKKMCSEIKEFGEDLLFAEIHHSLKVLLTRGTAKQVGEEELGAKELSCISIIAQPESEGPLEFSPTSTEHTYIRSHLINKDRPFKEHGLEGDHLAHFATQMENHVGPLAAQPQRSPSKRRKRQRRKRRREHVEECEQGTLSGVPEQESSGSISQEDFLISCYDHGRFQRSAVQETEGPGLELIQRACPALPAGFLPHDIHPWDAMSIQDSWANSLVSSLGEYDIALKALQNTVSQEDRCFLGPFFKALERETAEESLDACNADINEGFLFHPEEQLKPKNYEFREGRDFSLINHIQSGSYGDVYSVQDNSTGFKCAAKKIPLSNFKSEEVGSWSVLKSPRVVELFGAVREGPNVILFMDLKPSSLGQLLRERGRLPEDLALHYHSQVLEALQHIHKQQVLHLDVKADNVLLSEDGKDIFLCDFGHSERLGPNGESNKANHGQSFRGTETHMAPEVVKGEPRCAKADVWSSCCMLLHMVNGCHPWTRFYSHPLCLKIANEPPPLREIPANCKPYTIDVFKAGLQKEPMKRASAVELLEKVTKALRKLGGLKSPITGAYQEPASVEHGSSRSSRSMSPLRPAFSLETSSEQIKEWVSPWRETAQKEEEESEEEDEEELESEEDDNREWESSDCISLEGSLRLPACDSGPWRWEQVDSTHTVSEQELQKLSRDLVLGSLSQPHPPELQEQLLSCLGSDCISNRDPGEKDSGWWSVSMGDDLSSGVYSSYSSQTEGQSFNVGWLGSSPQPSARCFEGVDVCIENFNGQFLWIRESPKVTVGHVATGISEQISERSFSLVTLDGRLVPHDQVLPKTGLQMRCVHAPRSSTAWTWRVCEGMLDTRE
ncbi:mitogen-activated protein kinase kinase kinase 14 isoform X3 [Brienomyrus brachyistius]|uniref:mitogen-activated protein kinase kinase kinase 14 isoform X3 n=1 Tax=Brienomyrus brachyistius TaxID=42636 RepID=UPI0020B44C96|nr:mitogen-activated protein kinase kinase kinase 14 isoform X3 [Brienomyrus brachyistius]